MDQLLKILLMLMARGQNPDPRQDPNQSYKPEVTPIDTHGALSLRNVGPPPMLPNILYRQPADEQTQPVKPIRMPFRTNGWEL